MNLPVSCIVGLPCVPGTNRGVRDWLKRPEVPLFECGNRFTSQLSDLPAPVRRAGLARAAWAGLESGVYDEEAHEDLMGATPGMRAKAERLAEMARFVLARRNAGMTRLEVFAAGGYNSGPNAQEMRPLTGFRGGSMASIRSISPPRFWTDTAAPERQRRQSRMRFGRCLKGALKEPARLTGSSQLTMRQTSDAGPPGS